MNFSRTNDVLMAQNTKYSRIYFIR